MRAGREKPTPRLSAHCCGLYMERAVHLKSREKFIAKVEKTGINNSILLVGTEAHRD